MLRAGIPAAIPVKPQVRGSLGCSFPWQRQAAPMGCSSQTPAPEQLPSFWLLPGAPARLSLADCLWDTKRGWLERPFLASASQQGSCERSRKLSSARRMLQVPWFGLRLLGALPRCSLPFSGALLPSSSPGSKHGARKTNQILGKTNPQLGPGMGSCSPWSGRDILRESSSLQSQSRDSSFRACPAPNSTAQLPASCPPSWHGEEGHGPLCPAGSLSIP